MQYFPFVKAKMNEVSSFTAISDEASSLITPVFDIPRPKSDSEEHARNAIRVSKKHIDRYFPENKEYYLDIFDLNPTTSIDGRHLYEWTLSYFSSRVLIPVVGLDRDSSHIKSVKDYFSKGSGDHSRCVCIRLLQADFEDFELIEDELSDLISEFSGYIDSYDMAIDCRVVSDAMVSKLASEIQKFLDALDIDFSPRRCFVGSSSISPVASDYVKPSSQARLSRCEKEIWKKLKASVSKSYDGRLFYGDYGVVSPNYSDPNVQPGLFNSISTPKAIYTYDNAYFAVRGGSFASHPRGRAQYHDLAAIIVSKPFFRGSKASDGDEYIEKSALGLTKKGSAGTWIKCTLISHFELVKNEVFSGDLRFL